VGTKLDGGAVGGGYPREKIRLSALPVASELGARMGAASTVRVTPRSRLDIQPSAACPWFGRSRRRRLEARVALVTSASVATLDRGPAVEPSSRRRRRRSEDGRQGLASSPGQSPDEPQGAPGRQL